ncbi:MAG: transcription termination factor NusA [Chloroflexi bacterium]|nr:transcription termination factor NusA [Chloroflexota bacterium]
MKNEFTLAFNEVLEDKGLPKEIILQALESAMISAYRRSVNASTQQIVEATVDIETGKVTISAQKEVVETVENDITEVTLEDARKVNPEIELGGLVIVETTPTDFGRVAAQTARQVIQQKIRDAERQAQILFYEKQLGEIVNGMIQSVGGTGLTVGLELKTEASMPRKEMIPGERFHIHDRVRALVAEVKDNQRGPQIILSRTHRNFLRRLLENEVPEIFHGIVEIRSIAREPGQRAKVAVSATQQGIDPVGACVGIRGVRIQAIVRELHDEKIDVIEWNPDPALFIAKAISPARVSGVYLNEQKMGAGKTATVVVPEDQLSLAIGRDGQNARLAAKLTSWRIDIKSLPEATSDSLFKLKNDPVFAAMAVVEKENIDKMEEFLGRKAEGRPLSPEEFDTMTKFVDRVEKKATAKTEEQKKAEENRFEQFKKLVPASAFAINILDSGLPEHVVYILQEAGFSTLGELAVQMKIDPDNILRLQGIGSRAMVSIELLLTSLDEQLVAEQQAAEIKATEVVAIVGGVALTPVIEVEVTQGVESEEIAAIEGNQTETVEKIEAPEEEISLEAIFTLRPEVLDTAILSDEEEGDDSEKGKKKKKKSKHVVVTYDPDRDLTLVTKKHKRGSDDWTIEE